MTETELRLNELQKSIAHLTGISEQGWVMEWGETPETAFQIICRGANAMQVEKLETIVSEAHRKAATRRP